MKKVILLLSIFLLSFYTKVDAKELTYKEKNELAIVIDDFGNNMKGTEDMLNLPVPITVAIMPFLPTSKEDAIRAHEKGHEVIIHLPLEPKKGKKSWLGPGAITTNLSSKEIRKRVEDAIESI
ncbi:MAG TPA: divergent polysaccharide deacetylase family protein, partial [Niallia sp.]|nr:divergent polysaccharide deacetylase family protein [Niallia sp.]